MAIMKDSLIAKRKKSLEFVLARKPVSATWNEAFVDKYFSTSRKKTDC